MNFNPEKIKQLAEGKAVLDFTGKAIDVPLLNNVMGKTLGKTTTFGGIYKFYFFDTATGFLDFDNKIPAHLSHLPIIPLHDFVSPTKEEKITIDTIDARLKELEKLRDETPELIIEWVLAKRKAKEEQPKAEWKPKVGEWFKDEEAGYFLCIGTDSTGLTGDNQNGGYYDADYGTQTKPTEEEICNYLIGLAKQRYPVGSRVKQQWGGFEFNTVSGIFSASINGNIHTDNWCVWNNEAKVWAEVLPQAKEEFKVEIFEYHDTHNYCIRITKDKGLTQSEAEKYAETIKNALNGTN